MTMPASTLEDGMALANPDVCRVQVGPAQVPTPFPNLAQLAKADPTPENVMFNNKKVVVESSKVAQTMGDEAGSLGGVVSGKNMGEAVFKQPSPKVYVGSAKVIHLLSQSSHNKSNAPGGAVIAPSQQIVFVAI